MLALMASTLRIFAFFAIFALTAALFNAAAQPSRRPVLVTELTGVIGPPTAHHVANAIAEAEARDAEILILQINTPGGLETSMRAIIESILSSSVPVVGYVSPPGGRAASAGAFILYATHVAAMAPATNVGAATPINIGGDEEPEDPEAGEKQAPAQTARERKAINDAAAFIRSLAELRGRNSAWGEQAVRGGEAISAREALELGVIEIIANDLDDLLAVLDGRILRLGEDEITLATANASVERVEASWITQALGVLANPNVALLLMMIGVYGLIYEFATPGSIGPGVIGAVCLVLGLYALNQLPLNYAGLALIVLGMAFMVAEAFTPTFGVLGIGGAIAFLVGATMLVDTDIPAYRLSWSVILAALVMSGGFVALALGYTVRSYRKPVVTGSAGLIGQRVEVLDWAGAQGHVWVLGERWRARGPQALSPGTMVRVKGVDALILEVAPEPPNGERT